MRWRWIKKATWRPWVLLFGLVAGCGQRAWVAYPMKTPPDRTCRTGVEAGHHLYIWECIHDERVVIAQFGSLFGLRKAEKEVVACGAKTKLEEKVLQGSTQCHPVPSTFEWNTAP